MSAVGAAGRASELTAVLAQHPCDVLLLNFQMEHWMRGDVEDLAASTKVLILTASESAESAIAALRLGARAVVQNRFAVQVLIEAIRAVAKGLVWMPQTLPAEIAAQYVGAGSRQLRTREAEIVRNVALGPRIAEVAARLSITEATVKSHLNNVFQKLALRDRVQVAMYARRRGLIAAQGQDRQ
jgi:two-component system nitrate/nitrite response regulator NarL